MKNVIRVENGSMIFGQGGSGGSGGHTIQNDSGTALPQESALQFVGVYSEDDSTNGKTKVNIIREMTKAQMDALSTDAKKGVIHTTDEADNPANPVSADEVTYGDGTVEDALDELTDEYIIRAYTHNYSIADTSNTYWNPFTSDNIGIDGYTPIGIIAYRLNKNAVYVVNLSVENSDYAIFLHNISTQAVTGTFAYTVLYKKS